MTQAGAKGKGGQLKSTSKKKSNHDLNDLTKCGIKHSKKKNAFKNRITREFSGLN